MADCPHGLDDRWCSVCINGVAPKPQPLVGPPFAAQYEGDCAECELPIRLGDRIRLVVREGRQVYVHDGCEPEGVAG